MWPRPGSSELRGLQTWMRLVMQWEGRSRSPEPRPLLTATAQKGRDGLVEAYQVGGYLTKTSKEWVCLVGGEAIEEVPGFPGAGEE